MIIRRKHNGNFTVVCNGIIDNENLSFDAIGVLVYLLRKPDNWTVKAADLMKRGKIGRDKYRKIFRQLVATGYAVKRPLTNGSGKMSGTEVVIYDVPEGLKNRPFGKTDPSEKPTVGKSTPLIKTESITNTEKVTNTESIGEFFEEFWRVYPKRKPHPQGSKQLSLTKFKTKIKNGATPEEIIDGARGYARYCEAEDIDPQYISQPIKWLNQELWADDYGSNDTQEMPEGVEWVA